MTTTSPETDPLAPRLATLAGGRRALIAYLTAGFPDPARTPELLRMLADAGADVLELGVPFSDPLADGPTIQRASQRAIEAGASLPRALEALERFREAYDTPVVVFSYLNPLLAYGVERFARDAAAAGAEGVLVTDLPVGEDPEVESFLESSPLALVRLVAPTTGPERALDIARRAQGFLYYISRTGVTGATATLRDELAREVRALRDVATVPVAVGFGISSPEQAAAVSRLADGVVVGSAIIEALEQEGPAAASTLVRTLRRAMDDGR